MISIFQKGGFFLRYKIYRRFTGFIRKLKFQRLGMRIGKGTHLNNKLYSNWPHQIAIGNNCNLEHGIYFKFDGIWKQGPSIHIGDRVFLGSGCEFNIRQSIYIGSDSLIASGCRFIDHDHGILAGQLIRTQNGIEKGIKIGRDVWLGCNVVVLKGVEIGDGAIVAAGAVVTKSIPSNEIWADVPAKKIGERK